MEENKTKIRPYWHVDAKWIVGIILLFVFTFAFLSYNLFALTSKENSVKISSTLLSSFISPGEIKDSDVAKIRNTIRQSPDKTLKPFPGLDVEITEKDLDQYSPAELKSKLFTQLAEKVYDSSEFQSKQKNAGLMAIFTKDAHDSIGNNFTKLFLASFLLIILLVLFSSGFGRIISPGIIFILVGLPTYLFLFAVQHTPASSQTVERGEVNMVQQAGAAAKQITPLISEVVIRNYLYLSLLGLFLIIAGIIGGTILKLKHKHKFAHK